MRGGPPWRASQSDLTALLPTLRAAVGICDERGREREQSDRKHDERAVDASGLAHRSLLSGSVCAPVTLDPTPNRSPTSG